MDLEKLRTVLLISLTIMVLVLLIRRFRQWILRRHVPAPMHAEVMALEVMYHPARLRVEVRLPGAQRVHTRLLDTGHTLVHEWDFIDLRPGIHVLERALPQMADGDHVLEVSTDTQRTFRTFRLRTA